MYTTMNRLRMLETRSRHYELIGNKNWQQENHSNVIGFKLLSLLFSNNKRERCGTDLGIMSSRS